MPAWICPSSVSTIPSLPWGRLDHEPREITAACLLPDGSDTPGLLDSTRYYPTMDPAARTGCSGGRTMASTTQADVGSHHRRCSGERPGHKQLSPGHRLRSTLPAVLLPPRANALLRRHRSHQAEDSRRTGLPRQHRVAGTTGHTGCRRRRRLDRRAVTLSPAGTAACGNRRGSAKVSAAAGTGCHHPDRGHGPGDVIAGRDGPIQRIDCPESTGLPVWPSYRRGLHHKTPYHELVEALACRCDESPRLQVLAGSLLAVPLVILLAWIFLGGVLQQGPGKSLRRLVPALLLLLGMGCIFMALISMHSKALNTLMFGPSSPWIIDGKLLVPSTWQMFLALRLKVNFFPSPAVMALRLVLHNLSILTVLYCGVTCVRQAFATQWGRLEAIGRRLSLIHI